MSYLGHLDSEVFKRLNYPKTVVMAPNTFFKYFRLSISSFPTHSTPCLNQSRHLDVQQRQTGSLKCFHIQAYSSQVRHHLLNLVQSQQFLTVYAIRLMFYFVVAALTAAPV